MTEFDTEDFSRPLVCPDTDTEQHANAFAAAKVLRARGWQNAEARGVVQAVRTGKEYCGRCWDWKADLTKAVK